MFESETLVFSDKPSRRELLAYVPRSEREVKITVYRNHSFELVEHTIGAFLDFAGLKAKFSYSDYDDSLSFVGLDRDADLMILWLDTDRYKTEDLSGFLARRIQALTAAFPKPVLLVPIGEREILSDLVPTVSFAEIREKLGEKFYDLRLESATGTRLSSAALISFSKELGLKYLPALLSPALKGIVTDLDNTLYQGVLGEDGAEGVVLTEGHKKLQTFLKEKADHGWFLCVASKNDPRDVETLFEMRKDFPLKKEDFTVIRASWNAKSESAEEIRSILNVGFDSLLFLDDNAGEIAAMAAAHPDMKCLLASESGEETYRKISYYPGLMKLKSGADDSIRKTDVKSNERRNQLQKTLSKEEYLRSLAVKLDFYIDAEDQAPRVSELANKTNQFIFNYKRYSLPAVTALMKGENSVVISAKLSDSLSDSGTVGVCAGVKTGDVFDLEECFVSCRALGRGLDDVLVLGMIQCAMDACGASRLAVQFKKGERNEPAERFVQTYLIGYLGEAAAFHFDPSDAPVEIKTIKGR